MFWPKNSTTSTRTLVDVTPSWMFLSQTLSTLARGSYLLRRAPGSNRCEQVDRCILALPVLRRISGISLPSQTLSPHRRAMTYLEILRDVALDDLRNLLLKVLHQRSGKLGRSLTSRLAL